MEYTDLPDLKMTALAIIFQTNWNSKKANRSNDFVVKEALAKIASSLEDDDIGYFYDPRTPKEICMNPGELVGKIANSHLPYNFDLIKGLEWVNKTLKSLNKEDYKRICVIVSDSLTKEDAERMPSIECEKIFIFGISKCFIKEGMIYVEDAVDLEKCLLNTLW